MSEMKVALKGLTCANCAGKIEDTLSKLSETQEVSINLLRQEMTVKLAPNASAEEMQETVERVVHKFEPEVEVAFLQGQKAEHHHAHHEHCGCGCEEDDDDDDCCACGCGCGHDHAHGDENVFGRKFFLRFGIGLAFFLAAVFLHEGTICTILYICAYLIFGYDVLLRAAKHIGQGKVFDENFLMSFSTIGALYLGEMAEAVFVMLFYQVGEAFQEYAVARSRKSITALLDIRPDFAHLIVDDEERKVDPSLVQVGDMILVKAGERIPLDGVITEGHAMLDTAALTGESLPRSVGAGDQVLSGCINMDGSLKVRVERGFGESTVMKILEMVENASAKKSKTEKFITRFARVYTPIVVLLAVLVAVLPPLAGLGKFSLWFGRALVFLVVSCPCALVLSVPLTYFAGIGAASKCGILVKGGGDLDTLSRLKTVVFDKTGTLTKGRFSVTEVKGDVLKPQQVVERMYEITKGEAIITTEVGQNQMWAAQFYKYHKPRTYLTSGGLGTMGYGLPAAIGAQMAFPDRLVVDVAGDGSIQMNIQELATAVLEELPIVCCIFNNTYLGMVRQWQKLFYGKRYSMTNLRSGALSRRTNGEEYPKYTPDFIKLAESYGAKGIRVTKREEIAAAFEEARKSTKVPTVIEFIIDPEEMVYPMVKPGGTLADLIMDC